MSNDKKFPLSSENAKQLVDEYWATQGGEKEREGVFKQLQGGNKATAATKEKKEVAVVEEEEPVVESRKRKARGTTAASTETATATTTNSRKKRAKADSKFPSFGAVSLVTKATNMCTNSI